MRYWLAVLLVFALTAGCTAYSSAEEQIAAGQARLRYEQQATAVANQVAATQTRGAYDAFALQQTQFAGEALALQAQLQGTQEAIAYEQTAITVQDTRSASDLQATQAAATAQTIVLQSTIDAGLRTSHYYATQTAIPIQVTAMVAAARQETGWGWFWLFLFWGLAFSLIFFLITFALAYGRVRYADAQATIAYAGVVIDARAKDPPALPSPTNRPVRIEFIQQNGPARNTQIADLPATEGQLYELAVGVLGGAPFSEAAWTGAGRPFSRQQFSKLRAEFFAKRWADWRLDGASTQGVDITPQGWAVMRALARTNQPPHPTAG